MAWSADSQYVFLTGQITNLSGNNIGFVEVGSFFGLLSCKARGLIVFYYRSGPLSDVGLIKSACPIRSHAMSPTL